MFRSTTKKIKYIEFEKRRRENSIWAHFLRAEDGHSAKCKQCNKIIKAPGGATTGLHTHLRSLHLTVLKNDQSVVMSESFDDDGAGPSQVRTTAGEKKEPPFKKTKLTQYFKPTNSTMHVMVSRMASVDGIPIRKFCSSLDLRDLFAKSGYNLPKSPTSIREIIFNHHEIVATDLRTKLITMRSSGARFCITLDEWTCVNNTRYMNINLHCKDFDRDKYKNLGLVPIKGSMTAYAGLRYLEERLNTFGLDLHKDITCITTDGASVMAKMGRCYDGLHQLCMAHGIQLSVVDVLYKQKKHTVEESVSAEGITVEDEKEAEEDCQTGEAENSDSDDHQELDEIFKIQAAHIEVQSKFIYRDVIQKVRRIARMFRKSPTKNDVLQNYVTQEHGHRLNLILDCKTRWSSLCDMLGRFIKLKDCINKAYIDMKLEFCVTDDEIQTLEKVHKSLEAIKVTVEAICQRDATLITADTALKFMLQALQEQRNSLSDDLVRELKKRIQQRRLSVSSVLMYLHDPETYFEDNYETDTFIKPNTRDVLKELCHLLKSKCKGVSKNEDSEENIINQSDVVSDRASTSAKISIKDRLTMALNKKKVIKEAQPLKKNSLQNLVQVEMALYENGGKRGEYLDKAYNYLLSIPPTSVEAERAFSAAGYICNRLRSSLSSKMLDNLTFLRSHFQQEMGSKSLKV